MPPGPTLRPGGQLTLSGVPVRSRPPNGKVIVRQGRSPTTPSRNAKGLCQAEPSASSEPTRDDYRVVFGGLAVLGAVVPAPVRAGALLVAPVLVDPA